MVLLERSLAEEHGIDFVEAGSLTLFAHAAAQKLVEICLARGIIVLGLEGFSTEAEDFAPDMNAIADFSGVMDLPRGLRVQASVEAARRFLNEIEGRDLVFDVTLEQQNAEEISRVVSKQQ